MGVRATISSKLSKATAAAGKGITAVGRAGRQLGSSASDLDDGRASQPRVSAYAGMGPTGTAQDVSTSTLAQVSGFRVQVFERTFTGRSHPKTQRSGIRNLGGSPILPRVSAYAGRRLQPKHRT